MGNGSGTRDSHEQALISVPLGNVIGTHPNEVITSVDANNGYPVRQENGQRKTGPPPGERVERSDGRLTSSIVPLSRLANDASSSKPWL